MFVEVSIVQHKEISKEVRGKKRIADPHLAGKPDVKALVSTNPQSDRLCANGGNSKRGPV